MYFSRSFSTMTVPGVTVISFLMGSLVIIRQLEYYSTSF